MLPRPLTKDFNLIYTDARIKNWDPRSDMAFLKSFAFPTFIFIYNGFIEWSFLSNALPSLLFFIILLK